MSHALGYCFEMDCCEQTILGVLPIKIIIIDVKLDYVELLVLTELSEK